VKSQLSYLASISGRFVAGSIAVLIFAAQPASAWQELSIPDIAASASVGIEQLDDAIEAIEARTDLDSEMQARVVDRLRDARTQVQKASAADATAADYRAALDAAPRETEALLAQLDEIDTPPTIELLGVTEDTTLASLEQSLTKGLADVAAAESQLAILDERIKTQESRPAEVRVRLDELRKISDDAAAASTTTPTPGEPQILVDARKLAADLRRLAQTAETRMLEQELLSHSVRLARSQAERQVTARALIDVQRSVELYRNAVNEKRQAGALMAQQSAREAELAAADKHPVVLEIAEGNATLTSELPAITTDIERTEEEVDQVQAAAKMIEERLSRSRQRLNVGGLNRIIGRVFIEESRNLPKYSQYRAEVRERQNTLATIGLAQLRAQEQRRELVPLDDRLEEAMLQVSTESLTSEQLESIRGELRLLLRDRRSLLDQIDATYRSYLQALGDLDIAQSRLLDSAEAYREFLNQNLMWIPSAPLIFTGSWSDITHAAFQLLSPKAWLEVAVATMDSLRDHIITAVFSLLLLAMLVVIRRPLTRQVTTINSRVGRLSTDHIGLTLAIILIAAVNALPLPFLLGIAGWALERSALQSGFTQATASGLIGTAPFLFNVFLFREFVAPNGVARMHFGWNEENLSRVRTQLNRLAWIGGPLVFVTVILYSSDMAGDSGSLGRIAFVFLMVTLAAILGALTQPVTGISASFYKSQPKNWVSRARWLWHSLGVGLPLCLAIISMIGYLYTSAILTGTLVDTIWLALGAGIINLVVLRWLALAKRKIAWKILLEERAVKLAEKNADSDQDSEDDLPAVESQPLDLDTVDEQTRKLIQSGLFLTFVVAAWAIWGEVLPAFNWLSEINLWSQIVLIDGVETSAPVTLADVLLALVVATATAVASKNLPGLMQIAILQHLKLQLGSRYAIITLVRYVVVMIGVFSVLNIIGWNWSQIQWLVAALSVGLGFGLQEIVANFVSGLVILFERPVRVGDTVTVGLLTGKVSKVRIRATTITDWDRKEIIVPNKAFITEQVVNWTLSDPITRIVIPVGISYGSDVELAQSVMADTLRSLPLVLDEPPPRVYFVGFGDSSLDFKLYVFSRQLDDRLPLTNAVHAAIFAALKKNGITIPFPQRDVHMHPANDNK